MSEAILYDDYPDFNSYIDSRNGVIKIKGVESDFSYKSSKVLYETDVDAYQEALREYSEYKKEKLTETVIHNFPNPIAYFFRRSQRASRSHQQRLFFLRDTWEAVINTLYAITVSEFRALNLSLKIETGEKHKKHINFDDFFTDKISLKLFIIDKLKEKGVANNHDLISLKIIPDGLTNKLRSMNKKRNKISHCSTMSDAQAFKIYSDSIKSMISILDDLSELENVQLVRFLGSEENICTLSCNIFSGYAVEDTIDSINISEEMLVPLRRHSRKPGILLVYQDRLFSVSPFIHFKELNEGHRTALCMYKQNPSGIYEFEIIGHSSSTDEGILKIEKPFFDDEINDLKTLISIS